MAVLISSISNLEPLNFNFEGKQQEALKSASEHSYTTIFLQGVNGLHDVCGYKHSKEACIRVPNLNSRNTVIFNHFSIDMVPK